MISKTKEIVKRIRNYKKVLDNLDSDKKYNTGNVVNESYLHQDQNNNNNNIIVILQLSGIKNDNSSSKKHKKILSYINIFDTINEARKNKQIISEDKNRHKSCKNSPNIFSKKGYNPKIIHTKNNIYHNCIIKNNIYENNIKNYIYNTNNIQNINNINNVSINSSSMSQETIDEKSNNNNSKKKTASNDNNTISYFSNSTIRPCSDFNDTFPNIDDISLIVGKCKKVTFKFEKPKKIKK